MTNNLSHILCKLGLKKRFFAREGALSAIIALSASKCDFAYRQSRA